MRKTFKKILSMALSVVVAATALSVTGLVDSKQIAWAATEQPTLATGTLNAANSRVSVHDPSVVYGNDGYYYIFGSHMAWARSKDLTNWSTFTTNINYNYTSVFGTPGQWAAKGGSNYNLGGNLWAPDVIYNPTMKKWCMYMSINGDDFTSTISLATADTITGPYTYVGDIVYSGFRASGTRSYTYTDYQKATGSTNVSRFLNGSAWNSSYGTNAIDPCVRYDENGDLWMSYGSWFGGIYMLKLDETNGLRDYSYTYDTVNNKSDAYMGIRLAGGYGISGEGSYINYDETTGYYYLYLSYNGLDATDNFSGYHLRMYRSKDIKGPYTDAAGNSAIYTSASVDQSQRGVKLFGNYTFSSFAGNGQNSANGYMSGGHNSAITDKDGNQFLVYHTRFNNSTEWHEVRVHQQFANEDGWLVTAPYEYAGSKISETGYSKDEIVGSYEFINQGLVAITAVTPMTTNTKVILCSDGTITGGVSGTWTEKEGSYYAAMNIDGVDYKGVFFKQYDESRTHKEVMTFSLIGEDNTSVWASKITDDATMIQTAIQSLFAGKISSNIEIPKFGSNVTVNMTSTSQYLKLSADGTKFVYTAPENDTTASVAVTMTVNGTSRSFTINVSLKGYKDTANEDNLVAYYSFDESLNKDSSANGNNLTVFGNALATDGQRGKVAYFDGVNDYMQLPAKVTSSDDVTFMAWINSTNRNSWERIFDFGDGQGKSIFLTTHGYTPEVLRASYPVISGTTTSEIQANAYGMMPVNKWEHVAVTVDATAKTMTLYINGLKVNTVSISSSKNLTELITGTSNYLGKSQYDDPYFKGYMDDVAIFDTALSREKIQDYMTNGIIKTPKSAQVNSSVIVVNPWDNMKIAENVASITTSNPSAVKIASDYTMKPLSEGVAKITVTTTDGAVKNIFVRVEENSETEYGNVNGDTRIDVVDMEQIQKQILGIVTLTENALKAASLNTFDGTVSVLDMEIIQKHILGIEYIVKMN